MATTAVSRTPHVGAHQQRPDMVAVGTIVWLGSELMFFAALFATYFTIRSVTAVWPPSDVHLNIPFSATNTTVLVLSSVTCQLGVFAAEAGYVSRQRGRKSQGLMDRLTSMGLRFWFSVTFVMGAFFIAGQVYEYASLVQEGITIQSSAWGSAFFIATGFHGLHVTGGLIAFLLVLGRTFLGKRFTHNQATSAIVVSYYWHFVDVVWIALYGTIYFIK